MRLLSKVEIKIAQLQGKGFGGFSISQEVKAVSTLIGTEPNLVIDIGGNKGEYSETLRRQFKNVEIHIFEPSKLNFEHLQKKFFEDSRIHLNLNAISSESGTGFLYSNKEGSGLASLVKRRLDHFGIDFDFKEDSQLMRFEEYWIAKLEKRPIDLVKLDIEGFELSALKGFGSSLEKCRIIQFEFGGCNIDTKTYFQDLWYFFLESNFKIFRIAPLGLIPIEKYEQNLECFSTTNYIAVNRIQK